MHVSFLYARFGLLPTGTATVGRWGFVARPAGVHLVRGFDHVLHDLAVATRPRAGGPLERAHRVRPVDRAQFVFPWRSVARGPREPRPGRVLVMVAASSLRQPPPLVLLSAGVCAVSSAAVVLVDELFCPVPTGNSAHLGGYWAALPFGTASAAYLTARQSERLAVLSAEAGTRAREWVDGLRAVLHDSLSRVTALLFLLDRVAPRSRNRELDEAWDRVRTYVESLATLQTGGLDAAGTKPELSSVEVRPVLDHVASLFPQLRVDADAIPGFRVAVAGGGVRLEGVFQNLVQNALRGDGQRGATFVRVVRRGDAAAPGWAWVSVEDDG